MQTGQVVATVEYRSGDGPNIPIPHGEINVELGATDATLSWVDGDSHGAAAMPLTDFKRYVAEGAIKLQNPHQ